MFRMQSRAESRPKDTDHDVELGRRRNIFLKILSRQHRLVLPKVGNQLGMGRYFTLDAFHDFGRFLAFELNVTRTADEDSDSPHSGWLFYLNTAAV